MFAGKAAGDPLGGDLPLAEAAEVPLQPLSSSSLAAPHAARGRARSAAAAAERHRRKHMWRNPWADASAATVDFTEGCQTSWQGASLSLIHI